MNETEQKIYDHFKSEQMYKFSSDPKIKALENFAIDDLKANGYIVVKMRTIGYVIAELV